MERTLVYKANPSNYATERNLNKICVALKFVYNCMIEQRRYINAHRYRYERPDYEKKYKEWVKNNKEGKKPARWQYVDTGTIIDDEHDQKYAPSNTGKAQSGRASKAKQYFDEWFDIPGTAFESIGFRFGQAWKACIVARTKGEQVDEPKFTKYIKSFTVRRIAHRIKINGRTITIPGIGKFHLREFDGRLPDLEKIALVGFNKKATGWHIYFVLKKLPERKAEFTGQVTGIDIGVSRYITFANGDYIENPKYLQEEMAKLRKIDRALSRKRGAGKGERKSSRWKLLQQQKQKLMQRISNKRKDMREKITTQIAKEYDVVAVEDLQLKNMTKRAKKKNVKQKSGLNKSILDVAPGALLDRLKAKCEEFGKAYIEVPPQNTSITCSSCGYLDKKNRRTQSEFVCLSCGMEKNADHNAAINIMNKGIALLNEKSEGGAQAPANDNAAPLSEKSGKSKRGSQNTPVLKQKPDLRKIPATKRTGKTHSSLVTAR